jgi:8-oxo-dGTP pyrophosphatase MutT (NUDIX family)
VRANATKDHGDAIRVLTAYHPDEAIQRQLRDDFLAHLEAHPDGTRRECLPDHLTASAIVVDPSRGVVLLGLHAKAKLWLQMGGHIDAEDEIIADAALREAAEESGIDGLALFSEAPINLDRHPAPCSPLARYHLDVQFLAIAPPGAVEHVSPEQLELLWCPFDELAEPTDDAVRRLVAVAKRALRL